jgi:hypothetical protein
VHSKQRLLFSMPMKQNAPRKQSLGMATVLYITQNDYIFEYIGVIKNPYFHSIDRLCFCFGIFKLSHLNR